MSDPNSPKLVTLFGGGGFIGRYASEALLKRGAQLRIAERNPKSAHTLQPLSKVGQIQLMPANVTKGKSVEAAVEGADAVVYLVGTFDTEKQKALHVDAPRRVAEAAAKAGVKAFVHISALRAGEMGDSNYSNTKKAGEEAVWEAFPNATMLRPSVVFGPEDEFTNRFAGMMSLPMTPVLAPQTKFQPVFVRDLGEAIAKVS